MLSSTLQALLGSYDPNVLGPDQVDYEIGEFIDLLSELQKDSLLAEMKDLIDEKKIDDKLLIQATREEFLSNQHALKFFIELFNFISKAGSEPDISEYID